MRRVLRDAMLGISVLHGIARVDQARIGTLGHSYGGNTVLFHAAVDQRVLFACASGAACSYRRKLAAGTGIEMSEIIPGFAKRRDIEDLLRAMSPRPLLIVAGATDKYAADAHDLEVLARPTYDAAGAGGALTLLRDEHGHEMTADRFERIIAWTLVQAGILQP